MRRAWGRSESVHNFELRFSIHIPNGLFMEAKFPDEEWKDWGKLSVDENEHVYGRAIINKPPIGSVICVEENFANFRVTGPNEFSYERSSILRTSICRRNVEMVPSLVDQRRQANSYIQCKLNNQNL